MFSLLSWLRHAVRGALKRIPISIAKRILANSVFFQHHESAFLCKPEFKDIFGSWEFLAGLPHPHDDGVTQFESALSELPIAYIEFGVFTGRSMDWFSKHLLNPQSVFIGLDTFDGLPQDWTTAGQPKGTYSSNGIAPKTDDHRVQFIRGLFHQSSCQWTELLRERASSHICIAHIDSDIYGSALYALFRVSESFKDFYVIFDEFLGDECRALEDFKEACFFESELFCSGYRSFDKNKRPTQRNAVFRVRATS
jgi:hypothetical protein